MTRLSTENRLESLISECVRRVGTISTYQAAITLILQVRHASLLLSVDYLTLGTLYKEYYYGWMVTHVKEGIRT